MNNFIKSFKNLRRFNKIEGQYKNIVFFLKAIIIFFLNL